MKTTMQSNADTKRTVLSFFKDTNLVEGPFNENVYYDEPPFAVWSFRLRSQAIHKIKMGSGMAHLNASCVSLRPLKHGSFFTAAMEMIERISLYTVPKKKEWVEGIDLLSSKKIRLPAQTVYVDYRKSPDKPYLIPTTYNGAAAGINDESTLLHGLYEVIERDAFITTYLCGAPVTHVDVEKVVDKKISHLVGLFKRYRLEPHVFDITHDLQIPTFVTFLVDRTGIGPAVTVGAKTSTDSLYALQASLEESFLTRPSIRSLMNRNSAKMNLKSVINTVEKRGLFWSQTRRIKKLDFWLCLSKKSPPVLRKKKMAIKDELIYVVNQLNTFNYPVYAVNITAPIFKSLPVCVYRVIVPGLQPLYLDETQKQIKQDRIQKVFHYFGQKRRALNNIPHPLL